jgi:hypothetical protein
MDDVADAHPCAASHHRGLSPATFTITIDVILRFIQELQADVTRQARVKQNVAMIQAREAAERHAKRFIGPDLSGNKTQHETGIRTAPRSSSLLESPTASKQPNMSVNHQKEEHQPSPWKAADEPLESQPWKPAVARRGL